MPSQSNIYVVDADGKNQKKLTNSETCKRPLAWSPDGSKILFTSGFIFWPAVAAISFASILTAKVGANLSHALSEVMLKRMFGIFLIMVGIMVMIS